MKKLITIGLLIATSFTVNAQEKPSREQTIKFIDTTLKKFVGNNDAAEVLKNISFDGVELIKTSTMYNEPSIDKYSNLHWEELSFAIREDSKVSGFTKIQLSFETNFKQYMSLLNKERFFDWFTLYVPTDKIQSIEKAFLRLKEIAKEENKDPFEN